MFNWLPVYLALIILFSFITCFSFYDSTIGPNTMPRQIDSMAIGYDTNNDTILLFGGYTFSQQFTIFKENQFTDRGEQYLSSSQKTYSYSQHYTTLDDRLWIIHENGKNLLWIDLQTYSATNASFTLPIDVGVFGCLASHQTYLIVLGGYGLSNALNTVQIYDLSNNEWLSDIPTLLKKRVSFACLTVNNNTYAIGGYDGSNYLSSIEVLDVSNIAQINTQQWQYLSGALYQPTVAMRAVQYGDYIITIGGLGADATRLTDINLIDTATGNCDKVGDLAFGVSYAASIIVHNILYIFGGYTASGYDDRYQLVYLPTSAPTKTPTVSPTPKPSFEPTQLPSVSPTSDPTVSPTQEPTLYPTVEPTIIPSMPPTIEPSTQPSKYPTITPTYSPTTEPTDNPTFHPTLHATTTTINPTFNPTFKPTIRPTVNPTDHPSILQSTDDDGYNIASEDNKLNNTQGFVKKFLSHPGNWAAVIFFCIGLVLCCLLLKKPKKLDLRGVIAQYAERARAHSPHMLFSGSSQQQALPSSPMQKQKVLRRNHDNNSDESQSSQSSEDMYRTPPKTRGQHFQSDADDAMSPVSVTTDPTSVHSVKVNLNANMNAKGAQPKKCTLELVDIQDNISYSPKLEAVEEPEHKHREQQSVSMIELLKRSSHNQWSVPRVDFGVNNVTIVENESENEGDYSCQEGDEEEHDDDEGDIDSNGHITPR